MSLFTYLLKNVTTNSTEYSVTIEELNRQQVLIRIPSTILVILTMTIGFVGNILTVYVYGFRLKLSPTYLFVVMLACVDLILCAIVSPGRIVQNVYPMMTTWDVLCKNHMCLSVFTGLCNCGFLVSISVDRYRKVCQPLKSQLSMKCAKIITASILIFSTIQGSIALLYYGSIKKSTNYPDIYSYSCSAKKSEKPNYYQLGFFAFYLLLTVFAFIELSVVYTIILRKMKVQEKKTIVSQQNRKNVTSALYSDETQQRWSNIPKNTDRNQLVFNVPVEAVELSVTETSSGVSSDDTSNVSAKNTKNTAPIAIKLRETDSERRAREQTKRIQRITVTMMMITLVFIVTYIPCVIAMMVNAVLKSEDTMSVTTAIFYWLARHTFYLNSSLNPIIYSCRNQNFVDEVKKLLGLKQK
ncbi:kappa-type opioid receptor [Octopus bimaculoides]|uniref:G-protein coupled receptors family 1 profile domain-containing protein n=1 Tax=Octopus bimaculoides TaxID=37653 RepID=A0A0L8HJ61_OCTBM|nr:kappa-type opioid receptor [Octopus bimaculoides]XP_014771902.1 kappa-type opioid receptor [Octopus bimaculoides]|eukprot:XP_014771901.1 PREDICTED: kappa-type opioid receptor-like [Octopus bimaculoides]